MKIVLDQGYVQLVDSMGSDSSIVNAARVSYLGQSKGDEKDKKLLFYLMEHGHTSPFEMVQFAFEVEAPLFVIAQWQRHRTMSYNQVSRRYTSEGVSFWIPTSLRVPDSKNKQASYEEMDELDESQALEIIEEITERSQEAYEQLLDLGVSRELARMVLTQNLRAKMVVSVNAHNLMHFIELRASNEAQKEIRDYALALLDIMEDVLPWTTEAFKQYRLNK